MSARTVVAAAGPLRGRVRVPGDKSIAHRAVMFNAAAQGEALVRGLPGGRDVASTVAAMMRLGAGIQRVGPDAIRVRGRDLAFERAPGCIDCENSGTTMRLLCGLLAGQQGLETTLIGDASLSRRPMRRVAEPLARLGAAIETTDGHAPVRIRGSLLAGAEVALAVASAQVKSALLLAGLQGRGTTAVIEPAATRDHTERLLAAMGVELTIHAIAAGSIGTAATGSANRIAIKGPAGLRCVDVAVPGDPSSAAFLLAAATIVPGSDVTLEGVLLNPTRTGFVSVLRRMGADVESHVEAVVGGEEVGTLRARFSRLHGFELGADEVPATIDELPLLAAVAAFAEGVSTVHGAGELRVKESDRIATTAAMLGALGIPVDVFDDGFSVHGGSPKGGALIVSHGDHRIAMSAAVAALACRQGVTIDDAESVAVSFPEFFETLARLGA